MAFRISCVPGQQELQLELGAAADSLPREVGLCTMHLCPLKVSRRSPLGVGCGDVQKDMPRKDPSQVGVMVGSARTPSLCLLGLGWVLKQISFV